MIDIDVELDDFGKILLFWDFADCLAPRINHKIYDPKLFHEI
jgi:hypothetical protein